LRRDEFIRKHFSFEPWGRRRIIREKIETKNKTHKNQK
jgi:hypothetical protein